MDTCGICKLNSIKTWTCGECSLKICDQCFTSHKHISCFTTKTNKHVQLCKSHSIESARFCVDCSEFVCRKCIKDSHHDHTIWFAGATVDVGCTSKESLSSKYDDVDMLSAKLLKTMTMKEENRAEVDDNLRRTDTTGKTQTYLETERKSKSTTDEEITGLRNTAQRLREQIQEMTTHLAQHESEKTFIFNLTSILAPSISEIEGMNLHSNDVRLPRHQNIVMDTFTEQIEYVINRFITLKNNMVRTENELRDKVLEVTQWTNSHREGDEERTKVLRDTRAKLTISTDLRNQNGKLQQQAYEFQKEFDYCKKQISDQFHELEYATKRLQELQIKLQDKQKDVDNLTRTMSRQEEELELAKRAKEDLQSRIAGDRLTKGNPAIADLGDPNRPTRIAERYSDLYDNELTDALDCTDTVRRLYPDFEDSMLQEIILHHLHKLLKICYNECLCLSKHQVMSIRNTIIDVMQLNTEGQKDTDISSIPGYREVLNFRKRNAAKFTDMLQNKMVTKKIDITDWKYIYKNDDVIQRLVQTSFFKTCLRLCWNMVLQQPMMHFGNDPLPDSKYDKNMYREFLTSGDKVSFVVLPSLFLHEAGPLLCKGVIQAYS